MYILGINAYHGDAAAAIVKDGELIAAVEEERFNRVKHCAGFPLESVRYCLREAGVAIEDVEHIGISRDPSAHLHKKILFAASRAAKSSRQWAVGSGQKTQRGQRGTGNREIGTADVELQQTAVGIQNAEVSAHANQDSGLSTEDSSLNTPASGNGGGIFFQIKDRLANAAKVRDLKDEMAKQLGVSKSSFQAQFHSVEHHRAHLASSFYVSPFERAALLSIDGFGDFVSTMWALGEGNSIKVLDQVEYPHSTGIVYTATTPVPGVPLLWRRGQGDGVSALWPTTLHRSVSKHHPHREWRQV
jgi:predicted NodU family carbamoyl transferase